MEIPARVILARATPLDPAFVDSLKRIDLESWLPQPTPYWVSVRTYWSALTGGRPAEAGEAAARLFETAPYMPLWGLSTAWAFQRQGDRERWKAWRTRLGYSLRYQCKDRWMLKELDASW